MNKLDIENIFIDLDGTTLKSDKTISKNTINVIQQLKDKKINVFVATGRPPYMIKHEIEELKVNKYVITVNGGIIFNSETEEILHSEKIDTISSKKIISYLISKNIPYLIYTDKDMFYNCDDQNKWVNYLQTRLNSLESQYKWKFVKINSNFEVDNHNIVKLLIPTFDFDKKIINEVSLWFKKEMPLFILLESQENILDIIPSHSSKGEGIKFLANLMDLNLNKTIAFGDADNDIPMFQTVKYSVAMNNAVDGLKKVATHITDSNNEDGIFNFIKTKIL